MGVGVVSPSKEGEAYAGDAVNRRRITKAQITMIAMVKPASRAGNLSLASGSLPIQFLFTLCGFFYEVSALYHYLLYVDFYGALHFATALEGIGEWKISFIIGINYKIIW